MLLAAGSADGVEIGAIDVVDANDGEDCDESADSGAIAHPAGSAVAALAGKPAAEADASELNAAVTDEDDDAGNDGDAAAAESAAPASRLKNAVTTVGVLTIPTTFHPAADFSVRVTASAAGSLAEPLAVENSCMRQE